MREARIKIGGVDLTERQATVVRVALVEFEDKLATLDDRVSNLFEKRLQEVLRLMRDGMRR